MNTEILPYATYTAEQAAELLMVSLATVQRYLKSGKLAGVKVGKRYRIAGEHLLLFMGISEYNKEEQTPERRQLIDDLNSAVAMLLAASNEKNKGLDLGIFLHQSINLYATNSTLKRITADIKHQAEYISGRG